MLPRRSSVLYKAAASAVRAAAIGTPVERVARTMYGKDDNLELVVRAATTQADLTTPDWAGVLAHDVIASELIQRLTALSAAANLMQRGLKVDLTGKGSITIPGRLYNPTAAGAWVAEGGAIPVRQPTILGGPKLVPRKLAVLSNSRPRW
jgi:hypothetical protein